MERHSLDPNEILGSSAESTSGDESDYEAAGEILKYEEAGACTVARPAQTRPSKRMQGLPCLLIECLEGKKIVRHLPTYLSLAVKALYLDPTLVQAPAAVSTCRS
jgi:hypothetical protein